MKKAVLLLLCGALALCACDKNDPPKGVKESDLRGVTLDLSAFGYDGPRKIFILNEGQMGSNNASLDVIRFSDAQYLDGVFKKVNPATGGLGDVGNDIVIIGNEVWILVNNSGIVEVISAEDEKEIAAIKIPTPRRIAFDNKYAYVTSWAGAYATWEKDDNGNSVLVDSSNPKGCVYRINLSTKKVEGSLEVGYQPEGVAILDGKLYVANSGGISCQLPPNYAYDNTVSVINTGNWTLADPIEVTVNMKDVYVNNATKEVYVTSLGNYFDVHSGLYVIPQTGNVYCASHYATVSAQSYNDIY
ncbi:MAG: hypothetical protein IKX37_05625, partial [Bacteroidales bacterium]|nr:hypothetical protein [Bacteroidales bacterium]